MTKTFYITIFIAFLSYYSSTQEKIKASNALLESLINDNVVVGASGGFSIDGKTQWKSAVGYSNKNEKIDFNSGSRVRTASIAKSMTAVAIMQLVEKGLIDLNAPLDRYIPEFIQNGKTKITTKHLLSHTSGIGDYKNDREIENKINYQTLSEAYDVFKNRKLRFEPGTEFYYTSYGYVVLGMLIENISGLSYKDYMQQHIWDVLNMSNTGIEMVDTNEEKSRVIYHRDNRGKIKRAKINNLSNRTPAGGLYSTVDDLILFGNALLNNSLISAETFKLMTQHHSLEKINNGYGLGFYLYGKQPEEGSIIGHNGAQRGTSTQLFVVPSKNVVIVVVSNTSGAIKEVQTVAGNLINIALREE
ncbi:serine hydrolase [uncultured Psychroserpens sp.]|uniref:serine hydrolase domain-containing protein n=1 Tax=uncultured Psychroserpens sp. TaxID=255436 RepID=UPI002632E234|nr:serine hydrolase domain-containing protein [uncultured Psychroserpens sp.]